MALTDKQKAFVAEYLIDMNATQAAIRAGYRAKTAYSTGQENLKKPEIQKALAQAQAERSERTEISQDYVLNSLKAVADRCMEAVPVLDSEGNETGQWRFNPSGANKSLELLGKHLGMFTDKVETNISGGLEIVWQKS